MINDNFKITVSPDDWAISIYKNNDFKSFIKCSHSLYVSYVAENNPNIDINFSKNLKSIDVIMSMLIDYPIHVELKQEDLKIVREWIDNICTTTLKKDNIDFKNEIIVDYLKVAETFNKITANYIINDEEQNDNN